MSDELILEEIRIEIGIVRSEGIWGCQLPCDNSFLRGAWIKESVCWRWSVGLVDVCRRPVHGIKLDSDKLARFCFMNQHDIITEMLKEEKRKKGKGKEGSSENISVFPVLTAKGQKVTDYQNFGYVEGLRGKNQARATFANQAQTSRY